MSSTARVLIAKARVAGVTCVLYAGTAFVLNTVGAPAPFLLAGVGAGAVVAITHSKRVALPELVRHAGLGIIGVAAGALMDESVLRGVAAHPVPILLSVVATVVLSMIAGQVLRLSPAVSTQTALFSSIAGAASGVTAMARELKADEPTVASIQYLRVVVVLGTVSVVAPLIGGDVGAREASVDRDWGGELLFVACCLLPGLAAASRLTFAGSRLLLPMAFAMLASLSDIFPSASVPDPVMNLGYAAIGLAVGLSFTRTSLVLLRRLAPLVALQLVVSVLGCALIGIALSKATGSTLLDGYLATTPAGLPAVTAIAIGSDADVGLVVTSQIVRVFAALAVASVVGSIIRRGRRLAAIDAQTGNAEPTAPRHSTDAYTVDDVSSRTEGSCG